MGRFNTYQSDLKYTPESFEKIAMLPMEMRRRHDEVTNTSDLIALNRANTSVSAPFESEAGRLNEEFLTKSADLAARMSKEGASDPGKLEELRRLKNQYNTQSAANGVLGRGVADKASIDKRKIEYYANATKAGQSGDDVKANWERDLKARNAAASLMLKESPNSTIDPYNIADAPQSVDLLEKTTRLRSIMGTTSREVFQKGVTTGADGSLELTAAGLEYSRTNSSNALQLKEYVDYMNHDILDPNSDTSKDMMYKANGDQAKYKQLKNNFFLKVADLSGLMLNKSEKDIDSYTPDDPTKAAATGGKDLGAPISLVKTIETGEAATFTIGGDDKLWARKHSLTPINVAQLVSSMDNAEKRGSSATKDPAWGPMKQSAIRMAHIVGDFELKNKDKINKGFNEGIEELVDDHNSSAEESKYGRLGLARPKNYAEAVEYADKRIAIARRDIEAGTKNLFGNKVVGLQAEADLSSAMKLKEEINRLKLKSMASAGLDDNLLYTTDGYTIGVGEDADKLNNQINNYVERIGLGNFKKLASSSGARKAFLLSGEEMDIDEVFKEGSKVKFNSINTMNSRGYPSISFSIEPKKEGEPSKSITIDFREEGREAFTEVLKAVGSLNLDPISKKRIETMFNNVRSTALIPDIETDSGKFKGKETYSKQQSDAIMKDHLSKGNIADEFHAAGTKQSLTLNKAGYFAAKAAPKNSEDFKTFSIENQVKKSLSGLKPGDPTYIAETAKRVAAIHELMGYNEGHRENSLDKGALSLETNPTKRKIFANAASEMHMIVFASPRPSQAEQDRALMAFYEKVKGFGLTSKDRTYAQ